MPQPHLRAADSDRAAVAAALGEHMSAGRLTVAEYEERLAQAYAAKTYGELDALTGDLPPLRHAPTSPPRATPSVPAEQPRPHVPTHEAWGWAPAHQWRSWLATSLIVVTIWAATSLASWEFHYFWPIWVIGPWGAVLLAQRFTGGDDDEPRGRGRELRG